MSYIVDTNIVIHKVRDSKIWDFVNQNYFKNQWKRQAVVSVVTLAEAKVFGKRNNWGQQKSKSLANSLEKIPHFNINSDVIEKYIQLDLYSQNAHKSLKLPKPFNTRNMGKNDLWIAATAATYQLPLITTDQDFLHLNDIFLEVIYIDIPSVLNK